MRSGIKHYAFEENQLLNFEFASSAEYCYKVVREFTEYFSNVSSI